MTPNGQVIPIVEDDQGEGYMDVITLKEMEDPLEAKMIQLEKFRRRKGTKGWLRGEGKSLLASACLIN